MSALEKNNLFLKISIVTLSVILTMFGTGLIYKLGNIVGSLISGGCV